MNLQPIVRTIWAEYTLPLGGTHGVAHWARVLENARRLSAVTGAKIEVVSLFAVFHDSKRENEEWQSCMAMTTGRTTTIELQGQPKCPTSWLTSKPTDRFPAITR